MLVQTHRLADRIHMVDGTTLRIRQPGALAPRKFDFGLVAVRPG